MTATLALLMPCLNEARTLGVCIQRAFQLIETLGLSGEVIVADNGSTDGSQAIAEAAGARVVPVASVKVGGEQLAQGQLDAFATNKAILFEMSDGVPGSRVLEGRWGLE
ncbi:MAG: glycosyltransferase, partial [Alphaproteobacteria bacterium]|nr:glycosyltransferase [Alphaproteobacteria bacterium]